MARHLDSQANADGVGIGFVKGQPGDQSQAGARGDFVGRLPPLFPQQSSNRIHDPPPSAGRT